MSKSTSMFDNLMKTTDFGYGQSPELSSGYDILNPGNSYTPPDLFSAIPATGTVDINSFMPQSQYGGNLFSQASPNKYMGMTAEQLQQVNLSGLTAEQARLKAQADAAIAGITPSTNMFENVPGLGGMTEGLTNKDLLAGLGATAQLGLGAYQTFTGIGQRNEQLAQGWAGIDQNQQKLDEFFRKDAALVAQNKRA